jgi:hypothetical protein
VNLEKLQHLLDAVLNKDVDMIYAEKPYLPGLGASYNKNQLNAWLKKRSDLLEYAKTINQTQLDAYKDNMYNSLSSEGKLIANKILSCVELTEEISNMKEYDKFIYLMIYCFITT